MATHPRPRGKRLHRVGMDLSKVTFPTFVLEPRSMLECIMDFMAHLDLIFGCIGCVAAPSCTIFDSNVMYVRRLWITIH
jgi:hypothetical protein